MEPGRLPSAPEQAAAYMQVTTTTPGRYGRCSGIDRPTAGPRRSLRGTPLMWRPRGGLALSRLTY